MNFSSRANLRWENLTRVAAKAGEVALLAVFAWVWLPVMLAYAVVWFARFGWEFADDLMAGL